MRAQCWTSLTSWTWSQCSFWATGRVACLCPYLPTETDQVCLIKGSALLSFRSIIVIRCKQRECQMSLLQFLDLSFKMMLFPSLVNHHPWLIKPWDSPSKQDISVHGSSAAQPSSWDTAAVQADSTQEELNHLPWPCCRSGPTEQRAGRASGFLLLNQYGNKGTKGVTMMSKAAGLLQSSCSQTCASWHLSSFLSSVYLRDLFCCWLWGETAENN